VPEPLIPELPLPEPLLPDPEVCASTNGAVTTSTARAANTFWLHLLNISVYSYSLSGCVCCVAHCEPYSLARHRAWEPCPGGSGAICMPEAHADQRALREALRRYRMLLFWESTPAAHVQAQSLHIFSKREYAVCARRQHPLAAQSAVPLQGVCSGYG